MSFVVDTFTDADGTNLSAHAGETGAAWTLDNSTTAPAVQIAGNAIECATGGTLAVLHPSGTPAADDYSVAAPLDATATGNYAGVLLRYDTSTGARYFLGVDPTPRFVIFRYTAWLTGASVAFGGTPSDQVDGFVARVSGDTLSLYTDGGTTPLLTYTDGSPLTGGTVGVQFFNSGGVEIKSFTATDAGGGGGGSATAYTLAAPSSSDVGGGTLGGPSLVASGAFTITPNGTYTGTVTVSDGGAGGTFTPPGPLSWSASSTGQTFTYTPAAGATGTTVTLAATNSGSLTDPSSLAYLVASRVAIVDGDSISDIAFHANNWVKQVRDLLGPTWAVHTYAKSGNTIIPNANGTTAGYTSEVADSASAVDAALADAGRAANVFVHFCGTNDIYFGDTGSNTYASFVTFTNARKAAHPAIRTVGVSILPRSVASPFETQRQAFLAAWKAGIRGVVDAAVMPDLDVRLSDPTNATYFADGTHPTDAGYGILAEQILAGISHAIDTPPAGVGTSYFAG